MAVVMVTGGSGFIGSYTTRKLLERGHEIVVYSRHPPPDITNKVHPVVGDIRDFGNILSAIKRYDVEYVVHTVSLLTVASQKRPPLAFKISGEGTLNILEAARLMDTKRVVYISGSSVYGTTRKGEVITEDYPKNPVTIYGATKLLCEHYGRNYSRDYGFDFVATRFPIVYGPGKSRRGFHFFKDCIEGAVFKKNVRIPWGGEQLFEPLYIKDAVHGVVLSIFAKGLKHTTFNIGAGTGKMYTLHDLTDIVKKLIPDATIEIGPGEVIEEPIRGPLDITRAREELGYKPQFGPLEDGVRDYIECLKLGHPM